MSADRVIIVGTRRGRDRVSVSDLKQMAGRAGRTYGSEAYVDILVHKEDRDSVSKEWKTDSALAVQSRFSSVPVLAFHLLPILRDLGSATVEDLRGWAKATFLAYSGGQVPLSEALEWLRGLGLVSVDGGRYSVTELGLVSVAYYVQPQQVAQWAENVQTMFAFGVDCDSVGPAWMLGYRPNEDEEPEWIPQEYKKAVAKCAFVCDFLGLDTSGCMLPVAKYWAAMGGPGIKVFYRDVMDLRTDAGRVISAVREVARVCGCVEKDDYFNRLRTRIKRGVTDELADLAVLEGLTKTDLDTLYGELGIETPEELAERMEDIRDLGNPRLTSVVSKYVKVR